MDIPPGASVWKRDSRGLSGAGIFDPTDGPPAGAGELRAILANGAQPVNARA